jgi:hypothetical protein
MNLPSNAQLRRHGALEAFRVIAKLLAGCLLFG